jgi:putative transposase
MENTRRLERLVHSGKARVLNATRKERWGRLFVSFSCLVENHPRPAPTKGGRAGVDLGLGVLATVVDDSGTITEFENPAPLPATLTERRRVGRQMSRPIPGSIGHRAAKAKLARLDRRAVHLRREAAHQLTSWLAGTYSEVVIEDLNLVAMKKSMGRRAFRRSVSDAALGQIRPQLTYKMAWRGGTLTIADRWFASSQIHHGCGCRLIEPRKLAKQVICATTGELVDRDINAAHNLRDWPGYASCDSVGATAPKPSSPTGSGGGLGSDAGPSGAGGGNVRPSQSRKAATGEAETNPGNRCGTPRRGAA